MTAPTFRHRLVRSVTGRGALRIGALILTVAAILPSAGCSTSSKPKDVTIAPRATLAKADEFAAAERAFRQPVGIEQLPQSADAPADTSDLAPGVTRPAVPDERADQGTDLTNGVGPRPVRLFVSTIQVDAPVQPVGLTTQGELEVPVKADIPGWWSGGKIPGKPGPTVIVGHVDSKVGAGVFVKLRDIQPGDRIFVLQSDGTIFSYLAETISRHDKDDFPTKDVYGPTEESTLRLITCGGAFNRKTGHYVDNIIVFAKLETVDAGLASAASNVTPSIETTTTVPGSSTTSTVATNTTTSVVTSTTSIESVTGTTLPAPPTATSSTIVSSPTTSGPSGATAGTSEPKDSAVPANSTGPSRTSTTRTATPTSRVPDSSDSVIAPDATRPEPTAPPDPWDRGPVTRPTVSD